MADQLIEKGYLEKRQGDSRFPRPVLYLTAMAERALGEKEKEHIKNLSLKKKALPKKNYTSYTIKLQLPAKEEVVISEGKSLKVLAELKKWRREIASEKKIPPYCVFHDSTLIGIANQLPRTKEELEGIKGVGRRKIEDYGEEILRIVNER